ncbi:hypothetical protein [Clostridium sp.]|uniref:hypothetical protein n=1 Tax=Clostridium sp. TaxID=1506 RepID=UPI0025856009|nr:hypothetical protein [Clostridium sp.]MDF2503066.1 hypothetical protein [Clostridium sp.]
MAGNQYLYNLKKKYGIILMQTITHNIMKKPMRKIVIADVIADGVDISSYTTYINQENRELCV